MVFDILRLLQL